MGHVALRCGPAVPLYKRGFIGLVIHRSWASFDAFGLSIKDGGFECEPLLLPYLSSTFIPLIGQLSVV